MSPEFCDALHLEGIFQTPLLPPRNTDVVGMGWVVTFQRWVFGWAVPALIQQFPAAKEAPSWLTRLFDEHEKIAAMSNKALLEKLKAEGYFTPTETVTP